MMDCHEAKERMRERRRTAALDRHVARCRDCSRFEEELRSGGRALAEAYLDSPPSPGFEERVIALLREREIAVGRPVPSGRFVLILLPVAAALLVLASWGLLSPGDRGTAAPAAEGAVTEPEELTPLEIRVDRLTSDDPSEILLSFTGVTRQVAVTGDVDSEVLLAWALGARTARMTVGPDVPGTDIVTLIGVLERTGFSYSLTRER